MCDIRRLPDLPALDRWAARHRTRVRWLGATLEGGEVWGTTHGVTTRVCVTAPDGRPHPPIWRSPLEPRPAAEPPDRTGPDDGPLTPEEERAVRVQGEGPLGRGRGSLSCGRGSLSWPRFVLRRRWASIFVLGRTSATGCR
ncbi:hypothetical protein [Nocardiopsis sp. LOL_012]|uniref:hypothetical protein n=1 Tax=Nocardiopsis sp. LOL_012 TaxID=3345409 RepID=UPI003A8C03EE